MIVSFLVDSKLVEVEKETVYDADDNIINNSYLKYFEIKSDIQ